MLYTAKPGNVTAAGIHWDASSDDIYYYVSGARVMRYTLSTGKNEVLVDYALKYWSHSGDERGTGDVTGDNWLASIAPAQGQLCALDIGERKDLLRHAAPHPDNRRRLVRRPRLSSF